MRERITLEIDLLISISHVRIMGKIVIAIAVMQRENLFQNNRTMDWILIRTTNKNGNIKIDHKLSKIHVTSELFMYFLFI